MNKKIGILSIVISIFALIFAFALFGRIKDDYGQNDIFDDSDSEYSIEDSSSGVPPVSMPSPDNSSIVPSYPSIEC